MARRSSCCSFRCRWSHVSAGLAESASSASGTEPGSSSASSAAATSSLSFVSFVFPLVSRPSRPSRPSSCPSSCPSSASWRDSRRLPICRRRLPRRRRRRRVFRARVRVGFRVRVPSVGVPEVAIAPSAVDAEAAHRHRPLVRVGRRGVRDDRVLTVHVVPRVLVVLPDASPRLGLVAERHEAVPFALPGVAILGDARADDAAALLELRAESGLVACPRQVPDVHLARIDLRHVRVANGEWRAAAHAQMSAVPMRNTFSHKSTQRLDTLQESQSRIRYFSALGT